MLYLIVQTAIWLLLTMIAAALVGWAVAAHRAAPAQRQLRRNRDRLVQDLALLAAGEGDDEPDAGRDAGGSLAHIRESRIAELERALDSARARADDAVAEAAELHRRLERESGDAAELARLRALAAQHEQMRGREIETAVIEPAEEDGALQTWRLRYFEQRVRYLEDLARAPETPQPETAAARESADTAQLQWRAREAEARAQHLEQELRAAAAAPAVSEAAAFAADASVDALLRWRMLYLERRVAHLQGAAQAAPAAIAPASETSPDPDRWKWRARYLEARVRHLEQRPASAAPIAAAGPPARVERAPVRPARPGVKPPILASARNGAPDDLTLIEGVSLLQQSTLYSLGVFHFDQIAAWTPDHVAWVDQYLRLRGRIDDEEWIEQAEELARDGPAAARRAFESEDA